MSKSAINVLCDINEISSPVHIFDSAIFVNHFQTPFLYLDFAYINYVKKATSYRSTFYYVT